MDGADGKTLCVGKAPGRVNLIGEHVDYNNGFVMPIAINRVTAMVGMKEKDEKGKFKLAVPDYKNPGGPPKVVEFTSEEFFTNDGNPTWHHYVRGVAALLKKEGKSIPPFRAAIVGDVPQGGGLSSSASLEVATATFLEQLCGFTMEKVEKAKLCQQVEHEWCHVPCGIMDQFASVFGKEKAALLIDCKSNKHKEVPMTDPEVSVLIVNSRVKHALVDGAYKKRKDTCDSSAKKLGVESLREIDSETLKAKAKAAGLTELELQRATHVVTEIERTEKAAKALEANDYKLMGKLMNESHASLKDLYEVSCKELDLLVATAQGCSGVYGARMTGAGFGGSIVVLVETACVKKVHTIIDETYTEQTGNMASFLNSPASEGAVGSKTEL
uniref:Galactokinase n=1 Tax=Lotharella oceanica TaxID=641309 RepID=A0A7S2TMG0_9EUKA